MILNDFYSDVLMFPTTLRCKFSDRTGSVAISRGEDSENRAEQRDRMRRSEERELVTGLTRQEQAQKRRGETNGATTAPGRWTRAKGDAAEERQGGDGIYR
ncbi:hypothetical protein Q3G72_021578 [Acer saccharum]|nr:hypothetical protein Q3G72_021578 [Acer saccharum]